MGKAYQVLFSNDKCIKVKVKDMSGLLPRWNDKCVQTWIHFNKILRLALLHRSCDKNH